MLESCESRQVLDLKLMVAMLMLSVDEGGLKHSGYFDVGGMALDSGHGAGVLGCFGCPVGTRNGRRVVEIGKS